MSNALKFAIYHNSRDYTTLTIQTIAQALDAMQATDYEATVWIDALPRTLERAVGLQLRRAGIHAKKVRGVRKEENDALMRLADAVCGFVRAAITGSPQLRELLEQGVRAGVLQDVSS